MNRPGFVGGFRGPVSIFDRRNGRQNDSRMTLIFLAMLAAEILFVVMVMILSQGTTRGGDALMVLVAVPMVLLVVLLGFASDRLLGLVVSTLAVLAGIGFVPGSAGVNAFYVAGLGLLLLASRWAGRLTSATASPKSDCGACGRPLILFAIALFVSGVAALLRSRVNIGLLQGTFAYLLGGVTMWVLAELLVSEKMIGQVVKVILTAVVLSSPLWLYGMLTAVGKRMLLPFQSVPVGLNDVGGVMCLLLALTMGMIVVERRFLPRLLMGVTLCFLVVGLLLSKSRGAWVGAAAGLLFLLYSTKRLWPILPALLAFALLAATLQPVREVVSLRMAQTEAGDPSWLARLFMWRTAVDIIPRNLITGIGLHNFGIVKFDYGFPRMLDPVSASFGYRIKSALYGHTHNLYLEILMDLGLVGLIALLAFFGKLLAGLRAVFGRSPDIRLRGVALGSATLIVAFMVHSFFDYILWSVPYLMALAVLLGLALAVVTAGKSVTVAQDATAGEELQKT